MKTIIQNILFVLKYVEIEFYTTKHIFRLINDEFMMILAHDMITC